MRNSVLILMLSLVMVHCAREKSIEDNELSNSRVNLIESHQEEIAFAIRELIENKMPEERFVVFETELYSSVLLPEFYSNRGFQNAWISHLDSLDLVNDFIHFIEEIEFHGLIPEQYHLESIKTLRDTISNKKNSFNVYQIAQIDLLLSDAFFMLSSHLYHGKVDIEKLTANWNIQRNKPQLVLNQKLEKLIQEKEPFQFMKRFYPKHPGYERMVIEVKSLKHKLKKDVQAKIELSDGEIFIDLFRDTIQTQRIYEKLNFLGFIETINTLDSTGLTILIESIKHLQRIHGIRPDGKVGRNTLNALNQPIQEKINTLYVNIERLRWLPDSLNKRHIMVNIADFTLDFISDRDTIIRMRTVVGKDYRQTPIFNARMTYLVFSPTWTVPPTIMKNDVIPAVAKNIKYLKNKNMKIIDAHGKEIDPSSIDWQKAKARGSIPYRIRQEPGAQNALGRVKFMFPNKYNVYLHDTPSKELFDQDFRTFSSGCIRVDKPFELAQILIGDSLSWPADSIKVAMHADKEKVVSLKRPVEVYIFYLTAWSDGQHVYYRRDIYGRDAAVLKALKENK
jgi:L,D-transpeptidase YcbB